MRIEKKFSSNLRTKVIIKGFFLTPRGPGGLLPGRAAALAEDGGGGALRAVLLIGSTAAVGVAVADVLVVDAAALAAGKALLSAAGTDGHERSELKLSKAGAQSDPVGTHGSQPAPRAGVAARASSASSAASTPRLLHSALRAAGEGRESRAFIARKRVQAAGLPMAD